MCVHCYKLASDESRHRILSLLKRAPLSVSDLTRELQVKQPTVTYHLKLLHNLGLIRMEKQGKEHRYSLVSDNECFVDCGLLESL